MKENYPFIRTEQIDKIIKSIKRAVSDNGWVAVIGAVGTGKTEIKETVRDEYLRDSGRYVVIDSMSYIKQGSRLGPLMKRMLKACAPDDEVPGDIELRAERLKTVLMRMSKAGRKVILILDECQDLSEQTIRELKKLHEISALGKPHLFSILMFGKDSERLNMVFTGEEIGYRCKAVYTHQLDDDEVISFAEDRFGLKFPSGKERSTACDYFTEKVPRTPLGVKFFADLIRDIDNDGLASVETIRKAILTDLKKQMRRFGITYTDIIREVKDLTGKAPSKATVSEAINGKAGGYHDATIKAIMDSTQKLIGNKRDQDRVAM